MPLRIEATEFGFSVKDVADRDWTADLDHTFNLSTIEGVLAHVQGYFAPVAPVVVAPVVVDQAVDQAV